MKCKLVSFTPDGGKLAHSGPDGVLRIWDTSSGALEHEYQPAKHLKATTSCIEYSPKKGKGKPGYSLMAMGTLAGTVLLYSPEESEVKSVLEHSSHQPIMDVAWFNSSTLVSLARDNTLVQWNVETGDKEVISEDCEGTAICVFGKKTIVVGNRKIQVLMRKDSGKVIVKNNFTGHLSPITQMLKVKIKGEKEGAGNFFLSSSVDDRFIYVWSTAASSEGPITSFMVRDTIANMAVGDLSNNTLALTATTHKGVLVLFKHHLNGNAGGKAVKNVGTLQICSKSDKKIIPIVASHFLSDSSSIIIVYKRSSIFTFESLSIDEIVGDKELIRAEPSVSKELSLMKTVTPAVTEDAVMVGPLRTTDIVQKTKGKRKRGDEDNVASLPMEERLNVLALDATGSQGSKLPGTEDYAQLLLQGLHSKDQDILRNVFDRADMKSINQTVRRLPIQAVVPLLEQLAKAIMGKGPKNASYVKWVRSILYNHMSHLTTVPDRQELMQPFINISAARMSTFAQVTQLHARLDLLLTHVTTRQKEFKQKDPEPEALLVYREESSDEDEMIGPMIGISESEDNWDELSDLGGVDNESDMEVDQHLAAVKRKLRNNKDVNGEEEDDDDDEEEDEDDNDDDDEDDNSDDDDDDDDNDSDDEGQEEDGDSDNEESDDDDDENVVDMNGDDNGESDSESLD